MKEKKPYLSRRNNGYWYLGTVLPSGKKKWISTYTKKKSEAEHIRDNPPDSKPKQATNLKLSEFLSFTKERLKNDLSPKTLNLYTIALDNLIKTAGDVHLEELTINHIEDFKANRNSISKLKKGVSNTTLHMELRSLKSLFGRAVKWELISKDPAKDVSLPKIPKKTPPYLTFEQFKDLHSHVQEEMFRNLFWTAFYTGVRLGEIVNMKLSQVDFERNVIRVSNTEEFSTKTGKERSIDIATPSLPVLKEMYNKRLEGCEFVFHKPGGFQFTINAVSIKFKSYVKLFCKDKSIHFHSLRHSFTAHCLMAKVELITIKEWLGHSDLDMILRIYAHISDEHKQAQMKMLQGQTLPVEDRSQKGKKRLKTPKGENPLVKLKERLKELESKR